MSVPSGLGGSFVSQVLYTYMQFPVLEWRKDTTFTNYDFFLSDFNPYEPNPEPDDECSAPDPDPGGGGGEGGGGGRPGTQCPPCGQPVRQGEGTMSLSWKAVPDAKRYILQWARSPNCRGRGQRAVSVNAPTTQYALKIGVDVVPGEKICYRVTAIGNAGETSSSKCKCIQICPVPIDGQDGGIGEFELSQKCCEQAGVEVEIEGPATMKCCCEPETYKTKVKQKQGGGDEDKGKKKFKKTGQIKWLITKVNPGEVDEEGAETHICGKIDGPDTNESCKVMPIGKAGPPGMVQGDEKYYPTPDNRFLLHAEHEYEDEATGHKFWCSASKEISCDCSTGTVEDKPWIGQNSQLHQLRQLHPSCLQIWKSMCAQIMQGKLDPNNPMGSGGQSFGSTNPLNRFGSGGGGGIYTGYRTSPFRGTNFYGYAGYGYADNYWGHYNITKFGGAGMIGDDISPSAFGADGSGRPASPAASGEGASNIRSLGMAGEFLSPDVIQKLAGPRSVVVMKPSESQFESMYGVNWGPPVRALKSFLTNDLYLDQVSSSGGWETGVNQTLDGSYFSYSLNLGDVGMNAGALTIKQPGRYWVTANIEATGEHTLANFQSGFAGQDCKIGFEAHITKNGIAQLESQVLTKAFTGTTRETQRITSSKKILMHLEKGDVLGLVVRKRTGTISLSGHGSINDQWMSPTIKGTSTFITLEPISSVNY